MLKSIAFALFAGLTLTLASWSDAQDHSASLYSNWMNLCKSGRETRGAGSIGETILNCPEDEFEAKAAKSQIGSLAKDICVSANNSCTDDAEMIFQRMQCKEFLSISRAEKCGDIRVGGTPEEGVPGRSKDPPTALSAFDHSRQNLANQEALEESANGGARGSDDLCNHGFAFCPSTGFCCRSGLQCSSSTSMCQPPRAKATVVDNFAGSRPNGAMPSANPQVRTDAADACLKFREHRAPSMLCTPQMWCWTDLFNTCTARNDDIVVYYSAQLSGSTRRLKALISPKENASVNADYPNHPQIKGVCFSQNFSCKSNFEQSGYR